LYKIIIFLFLIFSSFVISAKHIAKETLPLNRQIVKTAREFKGINYNFGGNKIANGLDCSSFVQKIYGFYGVKLPRVAAEQYKYGEKISSIEDLLPGDLVFFETYRPGASHVGIYDKDYMFIHASSSEGITETSLHSSYFSDKYYGAKRVLDVSKLAKVKKESKLIESAKSFQKRIKKVAEFQEKKKLFAKQKKEMEGVSNYIKNNIAKVKSICPVVFDKPVKTYVYNTEHKTINLKFNPKFGEMIYVIGSSKALDLGSSGKLLTKACVLTADKKIIDLIDSRSISFFPTKGIIDKNCLQAKPINKELTVKRKTAKLRLYNHDYENVFGNLVLSYKLIVDKLEKGNQVRGVGIVSKGERKGDYCVVYNGNVVIAYEGDFF
jgi:hypothetical protein